MLEEIIKKDNVKNLSFPLLVKAYDEYIAIVTKENQLMGTIALNNGFVPDQAEIVKAEQLRNRITKIKAQI